MPMIREMEIDLIHRKPDDRNRETCGKSNHRIPPGWYKVKYPLCNLPIVLQNLRDMEQREGN